MDFKNFKANCTSLSGLMAAAQYNNPLSPKQIDEFIRIINKASDKITQPQRITLHEAMQKQLEYNPELLGATAKSELTKIYAYEEYGRSKIPKGTGNSLALDKGYIGEQQAIQLLSKADGIEYVKNEKKYSNRYFKGVPDIIVGKNPRKADKVIDVKISDDLVSFLELMNEPPDPTLVWQMLGYLDITNAHKGELCHCLINMPPIIYEAEKNKIIERGNLLLLTPDEVENRIKKLELNMHYDEIPDELKIIRYSVEKNDFRMKEAAKRVRLARKWLKELDFNFKKPLNLSKM
jgi:hypothetical protein